jgi:hypothetical protein
MPVRPEPGLMVTVLADGYLELFSERTGTRFRCGPVGTAMWIALRQHDGNLDAAADMLAELWDRKPENMRADMEVWIDELRDVGLVHNEL